MLELLRRGVKTWVAKILLAVLIISFAVWGIGDIFTGTSNSTIGTVGQTEVDADRYARMIRRQQIQMTMQRRAAISLADLRAAGIDRQVLSTLIREAAYNEELATLGLGVSAEEVARMIRTNPAFLGADGKFDPNRYRERLGQSGYSAPEFEQASHGLLGQSILAEAVRVGGLSKGTAELIAKWRGETRGISTLALLPATAAEPETPTDAVLQSFFEAGSAPFREPERRWGKYIRLNPADFAKDLKPTDKEIETEYKAQINLFTTKATRTVEQIVFPDEEKAKAAAKRIADGEAGFAEIAAEMNISVANLSLGTVSGGELPADVDKVVFAATEPGIVGPVKVLDGFALLNVSKLVKGGVKPLDEVKEQLATAIAQRHAAGLARKRATEIDEIRAAGATIEEIAEKIGVPLVKFAGLATDGTVAEGEVPTLAADPKFVAEYKAAAVGDERDVIELTDGGFALVMIDRIAEEHLPEFSKIKDKVLAAWKAEQRLKELEKKAEDLVKQAGVEGMAAIGKALDAKPVDLPAVARNQMPPMIGQALRDKVFKAKAGDILIGRSPGDQSVLIVHVREVVELSGETLAKQVEQLEQALSSGVATDMLEYFGRALESRHGATYNRAVIDAVFDRLGQTGY